MLYERSIICYWLRCERTLSGRFSPLRGSSRFTLKRFLKCPLTAPLPLNRFSARSAQCSGTHTSYSYFCYYCFLWCYVLLSCLCKPGIIVLVLVIFKWYCLYSFVVHHTGVHVRFMYNNKDLSIYLSIYLSVCLSIYLSVCLSVCLSIHLLIHSLTYSITRRNITLVYSWNCKICN